MSGGHDEAAELYWTDDRGIVWKVPQIRGRLKFRIPCHRAVRDFVLRRDRVCRWCGTARGLVADHVLSRRRGGTHHPNNMQALCQSCNSSKAGLVDAIR